MSAKVSCDNSGLKRVAGGDDVQVGEFGWRHWFAGLQRSLKCLKLGRRGELFQILRAICQVDMHECTAITDGGDGVADAFDCAGRDGGNNSADVGFVLLNEVGIYGVLDFDSFHGGAFW